jgi:hypothetical protein
VSREKQGTLQLIGIAFLLLCVLLLVFGLPSLWRQMQVLRTWPTADAQILRSDVVVERLSQHEQMYSARLGIVYTVDGKPMTAELTSFQDQNYRKTRARADEFLVGSRHEIRYNPQNPAQARIGAEWNTRFFALPLVVLSMAGVFGVIAGALFIAASRVKV